MARGRRAEAPEIKALKGNPGKRRLALERGARPDAHAPAARAQPLVPEMPAMLTHERERAAFRWCYETLPANLLRTSDVHTVARWCVWLNRFVTAKLALDGRAAWYTTKSNFVEIHREHPLSKQMDRAEAHLVTLEDRLCLNVVARNNVMHRLFNMPGAHPGAGLFGPDPTDDDKGEAPQPEQLPEIDADPLGFVERAGKPLN